MAERKARIEAHKKYTVRLGRGVMGESAELIIVNRVEYKIKRGEEVIVPEPVYKELVSRGVLDNVETMLHTNEGRRAVGLSEIANKKEMR